MGIQEGTAQSWWHIEKDEAELIEMPGIPSTYADGIARAEIHGSNVTLLYFRYRNTTSGILIREPVFEMVRPVRSVASDELREMIRRAAQAARTEH